MIAALGMIPVPMPASLVPEAAAKGVNGKALYDDAAALLKKYDK